MSILRKIPFLFLLMVVVPVTGSIVYYHSYASEQYVTEAHYVIRGSEKETSSMLGVLSGITGQSSSAGDSLIAQDYILSREFLEDSKTKINLREMFTSPEIDWWASLRVDLLTSYFSPDETVSEEDLLEYWQNNIISVNYDTNSGITVLKVTAFKREDTIKIAKAVTENVDRFVNELSDKSREDALHTAEVETAGAKRELEEIRSKIALYGSEEQIIVPEQRVLADEGVVTQLKGEVAAAEAELTRLSSFMQPKSMEVSAARNKLLSLKQQMNKQISFSKRKTKSVTKVIQKTTTFQSELVFAEQVYLAALSSLRIARLEVSRKQQYLDVIVEPQMPDESLKPEKLMSILTVFFLSFMSWGVISLLLATVKDHIGWV